MDSHPESKILFETFHGFLVIRLKLGILKACDLLEYICPGMDEKCLSFPLFSHWRVWIEVWGGGEGAGEGKGG